MAEYITGTEFEVSLNMIKVSFSKVTNISARIEYDSFIEGGKNDCPVYLKKPKTKPDTIIFEKGLHTGITGNIFSMIKEGTRIKNIMIFVKLNGDTKKILSIDEGIVVSKTFSDIDALNNSILIEKLEIAHSGLHEMQVVF